MIKKKPGLKCYVVSKCFIEVNEVIGCILKNFYLKLFGKTK